MRYRQRWHFANFVAQFAYFSNNYGQFYICNLSPLTRKLPSPKPVVEQRFFHREKADVSFHIIYVTIHFLWEERVDRN
jgi:hypothetical protein